MKEVTEKVEDCKPPDEVTCKTGPERLKVVTVEITEEVPET